MDKVMFIGDPHFKINNTIVNDIFAEQCLKIAKENKDYVILIGGDVLDTHERLHQTPYNKALNFIDELSKINKVFVLVGNHDYENNNQFLNDKHWMNPMKKWNNVVIVDRIVEYDNCFLVPYVPPGRFLEALDTHQSDWRNAKCIFAHQEFKGCNMGTMISENGDRWPIHYPLVISGHIHKPHSPQENIIYPGSAIQQNFGELNNETGVMLINFPEKIFRKINLDIPKMESYKIDCSEFEKTIKLLNLRPYQKYKIICTGKSENFKRLRKTNLYNNLPVSVTVTFKEESNSDIVKVKDVLDIQNELKPFLSILNSVVDKYNDEGLKSIFGDFTKNN